MVTSFVNMPQSERICEGAQIDSPERTRLFLSISALRFICIAALDLYVTMHTCFSCKEVFPSEVITRLHRRAHLRWHGQIYNCPDCRLNFPSSMLLMSHVRQRHSNGDQSLRCPDCYLEVNHLRATNSHFDSCLALGREAAAQQGFEVQSWPTRVFCRDCNVSFCHRSLLVVHRRIHRHESSLECPICWTRFYERNTLYRHLQEVHLQFLQEHWDHFSNEDYDSGFEEE